MSDIKKEYGFDDETDWKEVLTNPSRWFGLYYLLLLFGIITAGIIYLNNMNDIYKARIDNSVLLIIEEDEEEKNNEYLIETKFDEMVDMGSEKHEFIKSKVEKITLDNSMGAKLFNSVSNDTEKAITLLMNDARWMSSYEVFYGMISSNLPRNGFSSDFTELTKDQVLTIHSLLNNHLAKKIASNETSD